MAQTISISAERRTTTGKGAARQLRMKGMVPAVVYGHGRDTESLAVSVTELDKVLQGGATGSIVIELAVGGNAVQTLIREIQRHPTKMTVTHVDFYEIHAGELITLAVPIHLVGSPEGVRHGGGVLEQFVREIEIEVLPRNIPERVEVDVTDLSIGRSMHVSDVDVPNAKILLDSEQPICTVVPPRVEEEAPTVEVEEEAIEPELIRKPKGEEEAAEESTEE